MKHNIGRLALAGLLIYLATALWNVGIIATDDYEFGISRVVPAQNWTAEKIIAVSDIRSPLPNLYLFFFTRSALALGIGSPVTQLRFALFFVALIGFSMNAFFGLKLVRLAGGNEEKHALTFLFLLGFLFYMPVAHTRPLIENLASPFVTASVYYTCAYARSFALPQLLAALAFLALACTMRFQVAVIGVVPVWLALKSKRASHLLSFGALAVALFFVTGLVDFLYKGGWHASLVAYYRYQAAEIEKYSQQPFSVFFGLYFALSFPPVLLARFRGLQWKEIYRPLYPALFGWLFFIFTHSLVGHKEERFMIPLFVVFVILLTPLATEVATNPRYRWRRAYFLAMNTVLLFLASANVPQYNLIGSAQFVGSHPEIREVWGIEQSLFNFPTAFIGRKVDVKLVSAADLARKPPATCGEVVLVRVDYVEASPQAVRELEKKAVYSPGLLEQIAIKLNRKQNFRRGPIEVYQKRGC